MFISKGSTSNGGVPFLLKNMSVIRQILIFFPEDIWQVATAAASAFGGGRTQGNWHNNSFLNPYESDIKLKFY